MEILVYIILGFILGICVGNTSIRNKIAEEIRVIITQRHSVKECPVKEKVKYKVEYKEKPNGNPNPKETGGCNKCGGLVEPIDKMPGYFYCEKCQSITSKKKDNARP